MSVTRTVDYLSSLPPELLEDIFDHAHTSKQPLTGPLSTRLYPFFIRTRYCEIELTSYQQLSTFCSNLRPEVAQHIFSLEINIDYLPDEEEEDDEDLELYDSESREREKERRQEARPTREVPDQDGPSSVSLAKTFRMMESLVTLQTKGSTRLALFALSLLEVETNFPHLSEINLDSSFDGIGDPFHPSLFQPLHYASQVDRVNLRVRRPSDSIVPFVGSAFSQSQFPDITQLILDGPLMASSSASLFISLSPSLQILNLIDTSLGTSTRWRIASLVDMVQEPTQFRGLSLCCLYRQSEFEGNLFTSLFRFTKLQALALGGPCPPMSQTFYQLLARLPLDQLIFFPRFPVSLAHLKHLVLGPSKSHTLRKLVFDNIEAKTYKFPDDMERQMFGPDWQRVPPPVAFAKWTRAFSKEKLYEFLDAVGNALTVEGTAIVAITKEDVWIPLRREAAWKHTREKGGEEDVEDDSGKTEGGELSDNEED